MAEALQHRGHEVHVVTYHLGREIKDLPFQIHRIPQVRSYRHFAPGPTFRKLFLLDPLLAWTLGRVLRRQRIDLIHAHHYEGLLVAKAMRGVPDLPVVYDAHTLLATELPFYAMGVGKNAKRIAGRLFDKHLPGRADHVVAVTDTIRDRLVGMGAVSPEQISVVGNGVEASLFDLATPLRDEQTRRVVFAGNLAAYQGIDHLLEAFRIIRERQTNVRLLMVTESPFGAYEPLARSLGIREHIDVVAAPFEQLPRYLLGADVAVNPRSDGEGIPQKLMNYMAAARPIVSFEGSAAHLRHGETALLVPNGDVAAFAEATLHLLDRRQLAAGLGAAARAQVDRSFSWNKSAEKVESVYAHLLPTGRAGRDSGGIAKS
jgi:glycosyltransferase involved in cell wall biosynthesis